MVESQQVHVKLELLVLLFSFPLLQVLLEFALLFLWLLLVLLASELLAEEMAPELWLPATVDIAEPDSEELAELLEQTSRQQPG